MKQILEKILDFIYPASEECPLCGLEHDGDNCPKCWKEAEVLMEPGCPLCGRFYLVRPATGLCSQCKQKIPGFKRAVAVGPYEGIIKEALYQFKYTGKQSLGRFLALLVLEKLVRQEDYLKVDRVIPVPLYLDKMQERSFNQAELLARTIGQELSLPVLTNVLVRVKGTPALSKVHAWQRKALLEGAFQVQEESLIAGKRVLLVDDILTTGTTVEECTEVLLRAGAKEVFVITVAAGRTG